MDFMVGCFSLIFVALFLIDLCCFFFVLILVYFRSEMADPVVTLRFWHGGMFKRSSQGLQYVGGSGRTFRVDVDELCWWYLEELVQKCGKYSTVHRIYYLNPGESMDVGLKIVYTDSEVRVLGQIAIETRVVDLYVEHGVDNPSVSENLARGDDVVYEGEIPSFEGEIPSLEGGDHNSQKAIKSNKNTGPTTSHKAQLKPTSEKSQLNPNPEKRVTRSSPNKHFMPPLFSLNNPTKESKSSSSKNTTFKTAVHTTTVQTNVDDPNDINTSNFDHDDFNNWYDDRPEEPLTYEELVGEYLSDEDGSDQLYQPEDEIVSDEDGSANEQHFIDDDDLEKELKELEREGEGEVYAGESSDDEFQIAQRNIRASKAKLEAIAAQLQKEADEGRLNSQRSELRSAREKINHGSEGGNLSEHEESEDECNTPEGSDDEGVGAQIRRQRKFVSSDKIDYSSFKWEVGQRFPSRNDFRAAISKWAITQGKDLYYAVSAKGRNQRLGVKCKDGCPFRMYASWDNNSASFLVKSLEDQHTCHRTMEGNRQLKTSWLADQLLDVFKARPHWPAPQIVETVRTAYKVNISRDKAYKVKWLAHQKLHGSMKDHYKKLGRYLAALKKACPESTFILQQEPDPRTELPTFKRLFISYDALKNGWLNGCRKVLAIDGCFLKTFLGGQLLAAIGRDGNDQMFPLVWAVVEGECNESWEWFFQNMQQSLNAGDGDGWTIISDEHQVITLCYLLHLLAFLVKLLTLLCFPYVGYTKCMCKGVASS